MGWYVRMITYGLDRAKNEWGYTYTFTLRLYDVQRGSITYCFFILHVTCVLHTSRMLFPKHLSTRKVIYVKVTEKK